MKLTKLFRIPKTINNQKHFSVLDSEHILQYIVYEAPDDMPLSRALEPGTLEFGLMKIDLAQKTVEKIRDENVTVFHTDDDYIYLLCDLKNEQNEGVGRFLRYTKATGEMLWSEDFPEFYRYEDFLKKLIISEYGFIIKFGKSIFVFNFRLQCVYRYTATYDMGGSLFFWKEQFVISTEANWHGHSYLVRHDIQKKTCEKYPITNFFPEKYDYPLDCYVFQEKFLILIENDGHVISKDSKVIIVDNTMKVCKELLLQEGRIYFVHPTRPEFLLFHTSMMADDEPLCVYTYKNWQTDEVLWAITLTDEFEVNAYRQEPYIWQAKNKFIFGGFKQTKFGIWVVDILTGEKEFFKPIGGFSTGFYGGILIQKDCVYLNTVSIGKNYDYYYKLTD